MGAATSMGSVRPLRILHLLNQLRYSGAELLLASAADIFNAGGFHNTVLSTGDEAGEFTPTLAARGYEIAHLPFARRPAHFAHLRTLIRSGRYDVVHVHAERANFLHALTAIAAGASCVRTIHNVFEYEGAGKLRHAAERRLLARAGVVHVACSPLVARNERERFGIDPVVIDNWIEPQRFHLVTPEARQRARAKLGVGQDQFAIVSVGNCNAAKNHAAIIRAIAEIDGSTDLRYLHLGAGDKTESERELAGSLGQSGRIDFVGWAANTEDYLAASDAFVSASHVEGGQVSLLEAAAVGVACVTTRVGLAGDVEHLPNVEIVANEPSAIAAALKRVERRPPAERLAAAAALSRAIHAHYVPEVGANSYRRIYEQFARRRGAQA